MLPTVDFIMKERTGDAAFQVANRLVVVPAGMVLNAQSESEDALLLGLIMRLRLQLEVVATRISTDVILKPN